MNENKLNPPEFSLYDNIAYNIFDANKSIYFLILLQRYIYLFYFFHTFSILKLAYNVVHLYSI